MISIKYFLKPSSYFARHFTSLHCHPSLTVQFMGGWSVRVQGKPLSLSSTYKSVQQSHSNEKKACVISHPRAAPAIHWLCDLLSAVIEATFENVSVSLKPGYSAQTESAKVTPASPSRGSLAFQCWGLFSNSGHIPPATVHEASVEIMLNGVAWKINPRMSLNKIEKIVWKMTAINSNQQSFKNANIYRLKMRWKDHYR